MTDNKKDHGGRAHPRLKDYHLAKYSVVSGAEKKPRQVLTHIEDIGKGGACLETVEFLPVGTVLQIYINFPNVNKPIISVAKVAWIKKIKDRNKHTVGIQFLEIEEAFQDAILRHIYMAKGSSKKKNVKGWGLWG